MKIPRDVHGRELAAVLCRSFGYRKVNQVGSHIILQGEPPFAHRISIPDHKPLRLGTFNALLREVAAAKRCSREDILDCL